VRKAPLPGGSLFWRVHRTEFDSAAFNPVGAEVLFGGGRFDATEACVYGFMYGALREETAAAEVLLRDVPADDRGARFLPRKYWRERRISALRTNQDVELAAIRTGRELGAIGQDTWLTTCDPREYPQTRAWAHWLREAAVDAAGIIWYSKRDPGQAVLILFEDRCPPGFLRPEPGPLTDGVSFDDAEGFAWLRGTLRAYGVTVRAPRGGP
jgi:hypothetical protein